MACPNGTGHKKSVLFGGRFFHNQSMDSQNLADDFRSLGDSQVEGEVASIALVHHVHTQVGPVDHISPGANHPTLGDTR